MTNGTYTLTVRAFDAAGNMGSADYTFTTTNPAWSRSRRRTSRDTTAHIRIAELAYSGNPMGAFEQNLLRNTVDLVDPEHRSTSPRSRPSSPNTPQLIYSNVSNLYQGLLTDWLQYADRARRVARTGVLPRHAATPFTRHQPVVAAGDWFWGAYQTATGRRRRPT